MIFNSFPFLGFLAAVVAVYHVIPGRGRMWVLLLASYYFYSTFQPLYLLLLVYSTGTAYIIGRILPTLRSRSAANWALTIGIVLQLMVLVFFKYADFLTSSIEAVLGQVAAFAEPLTLPRLEFLLPVGLSFYTFSAISYLVDVYRGEIEEERDLPSLALYIAFFPKLLAGPIERANSFLSQVHRPSAFQSALFLSGLQLLLWGLFKKVVIADRLAVFVDAGFSNPEFQSPVGVIVALYLYAFQIYCDFSGYSDMAIGAAALFGIRLRENFRRPYFSTSVPEFWSKRWHISLMAWFRDYIYIPLGGNRVSKPRWYANQMIIFLISGLWHGANWTFVVWGALNGLYQVLYLMSGGARERMAAVLPDWLWRLLAILLTFHLILFSWIFFRADSFDHAFAIIERISYALPQLPMLLWNYPWTAAHGLAFGLVAILIAVELLDESEDLWRWLNDRSIAVRWGFYYSLFALLLVIGEWSLTRFVYMQF